MGGRTSRRTAVASRPDPTQAVVKRIGDLAKYAAKVYGPHDPALARKWLRLARRCERLTTPPAPR